MKLLTIAPDKKVKIFLDNLMPKFNFQRVINWQDMGVEDQIKFIFDEEVEFVLECPEKGIEVSKLQKFILDNIQRKELIVENKSTIEVQIEYGDTNLFVPTESELERFGGHLENSVNKQVLFSAPFGQGKTTFLNSFFSDREEDYITYYVSPVHYSIATNEDIFKYIKCEILLQLLENGIVPNCASLKGYDLLKFYIEQNPFKILGQLIKSGAKVRKESQVIYEGIESMINSFKNYKSSFDEGSLISQYFNLEEEKEGSLFEDDFYTQMIRSGLTKLGSDEEKKSVLIIDDLDRLDPEHIFRILNILSVHSEDAYLNEGESNKFGFDKIILVCDLNNIRSIFHHRYGGGTDFNGYMSKFYTLEPFIFKLENEISNQIGVIENNFKNSSLRNHYENFTRILKMILIDLIYSKQITLRDLIKISKIDFEIEIYDRIGQLGLDSKYSRSIIFYISYYLLRIDHIVDRISSIKKYYGTNIVELNFDFYTELCFVSLGERKGEIFSYKDKDLDHVLNCKEYKLEYFQGIDRGVYRVNWIEENNYQKSPQLFYQLLLKNIEEVQKITSL